MVKISLETVRKVNAEMIARKGKPRELTPLEKYADSIIAGKPDSVEFETAKKEFKILSEYEQIRLLMYANLRKKIKELCSDSEKLNEAFGKVLQAMAKYRKPPVE